MPSGGRPETETELPPLWRDAASTAYFLLYCVLKRNKPVVYPEVVLPGVISGVMWAVAQSSFFVANQGTPRPFPALLWVMRY